MGESTPFQREAWTEYAIGVAVLFLRYFARWRAVGFRKWQGDDIFAVLSLVFWTVSGSLPRQILGINTHTLPCSQAELCMLELIGTYSWLSHADLSTPISDGSGARSYG